MSDHRMDCAEIRDALLAGTVPSGPAVEAHRQTCEACTELLDGEAALGKALSTGETRGFDGAELWGSLESAVETALSPEEGANEGFDILPDGKKAPPLPDTAPQSVTFGVVQFAYDGAQFANKGARTKEQAREKARSFMELAQKDFEAAVAKGDRGSRSNVGRMHRGILEPAVEYLLFTLPKATVYGEPVDTPRGYWIIRRID